MTVNAVAVCNDFNMGGPGGGNKVTWAGSSALSINGNLNLSGGTAGITATYSGGITFTSTIAGQTIDTNGVALSTAVTFSGVGGGWTLQNNLDIGGNGISLSNGTWDTNGKQVDCNSFVGSGSNTRTLTLGASVFNVNSNGSWNIFTSTNMTLNAGTSSLTVNGQSFFGGGLTYYDVTLNQSGTMQELSGGNNTFHNLTRSAGASVTGGLFLRSGTTQTVTGTLSLNGQSLINRLFIASLSNQGQTPDAGTPVTISAAIVSISNVDFEDVTATGAGNWTAGTSIGDCGGNTGITFTPAVSRFWMAVSGGSWSATTSWSATSGGATGASVPLPQDTVTINNLSITSGSRTITANMPRLAKSIDFTGVLNTPAFSYTASNGSGAFGAAVFGALTLVSGMTITASSQIFGFGGRSVSIFTTAGLTIDMPIRVIAPGGTLTVSGDMILGSTRALVLKNGIFDCSTNNPNVTAGSFQSSQDVGATNTRTLNMGNGTWTMQSTGQVWDIGTPTNLTLTAGSSTIKVTNTTNSSVTVNPGGKTYNNIWFARGASTGSISVTSTGGGSPVFNDFKDTGTAAHSIVFDAGINVTVSTFNVNGSAGNLITINSSSTGTHTLTKVGAASVQCDFLNIQHSVATGAGLWFAGLNSTNNQAVATAGSGWIFDVGWGSGVDNVTVSESVTITIVTPPRTPNVSDSVTVTEAVTIQVVNLLNVNDAITVAENVALVLVQKPNVSDSISVSESVQILVIDKPNVSDTVTVTESVSFDIRVQPNVSDAITVSESVSFRIVSFVNVSDSITVAESVQFRIVSFLNVNDSVSVTESPVIQIVDLINVSDSISVAESVSIIVLDTGLQVVGSDAVTVSEDIQMMVTLFINVADTVTVTEAVIITEGQYVPSVGDDITVSEFVQMQIVSFINVSDSVAVSEATQFLIVYQSNVFDTVVVSEAVQFQIVSFVNVSDSISVTESVAISIVSASAVFDTVTVTESVQMRIVSFINVSDSVAIAEATQMQVVDYIVVSDAVTVSEAVTIQIVSQPSGLFDAITVTESIKMMLISFINVFETVHVTDTIQTQTQLYINVSDSVHVAENIQIGIFIPINKFYGTVKLGWKIAGYTVAGERDASYVVSEALNKNVTLRL